MKEYHSDSQRNWRRIVRAFFAGFLYQAVAVFLLVAILVPTIVYFVIFNLASEPPVEHSTCVLNYGYRVPCGQLENNTLGNLTQSPCKAINCCYDHFTHECYHYFPAKYGYRHIAADVYGAKLTRTPFGNAMHANVSFAVSIEQPSNVLLINFVPLSVSEGQQQGRRAGGSDEVSYNISANPLAIDVYRNALPKVKILETSRGPLITSDGYWEWTLQLTTANGTLFGLGGLHINGNHSQVFYRSERDHTSLPYILAYDMGRFHAVRIEHTGMLEVHVLDSKLVILRCLNTNGLGIRLYPGPSIEDIRKQLDLQPTHVERWMMGLHVCRNRHNDLGAVIGDYLYEIMHDHRLTMAESDCFHEMLMIFIMEQFNEIEGQTDITSLLQSIIDNSITKKKRRFILPFLPMVPIRDVETGVEYQLYTEAIAQNVLMKTASEDTYEGLYRNRPVAYLDFTAPNITEYLTRVFNVIQTMLTSSTEIQAVYLLDNWSQDESHKFNPLRDGYLYYNQDIIHAGNKTLPLKHLTINPAYDQKDYIEDQIKTLQSIFPTLPVYSASLLSSTRTTPLLPQYVNFTWSALKHASSAFLFSSIFNHPLTHAPICGSTATIELAHEQELCAKWFTNTAMQPGGRLTTNWLMQSNVHAGTQNIIDKALATKEQLAYYQYSVLKATGYFAKPMFVDFHTDNQTLIMDEQYMVGNLLIAQMVRPKATQLRVYLPTAHNWYEFYGGVMYGRGWKTLHIATDERLMFIKEGSVVPTVERVRFSAMTPIETTTTTQPTTTEIPANYSVNIGQHIEKHFVLRIAKYCVEENEPIPPDMSIVEEIFFENAFLKIVIDDTAIRFENILAIQSDINCMEIETNRLHPYYVSKAILATCNAVVTVDIDFNICIGENDTVTIPLII